MFGSDFTIYQNKVIDFFEKNDNTALLLYFTVGCGKTLTALGCAYTGIKTGKFKDVIILSPKSIQDEFRQNTDLLESFKQNPEFFEIFKKHIHMIPYNANNSFLQLMSLKNNLNSNTKNSNTTTINNLENTIWIIDELHLFLRSIIKVRLDPTKPLLNTPETGNAERILKLIKNLKHKKVIGLTGTPVFKYPVEITPFFNLNNINLPENIEEFNKKYVEIKGDDVLLKNVNELKNKLKNSVAYVSLPDTQHLKATELIEEEVEMSVNQYKKYLKDYENECNEEGFSKGINRFGIHFGKVSTFHARTFQDSVFVSEFIDGSLDGSLDDVVDDSLNDSLKNKNEIINKNNCPKIIKMFEDCEKVNGKCAIYFRFVEIGVKTFEQQLIQNNYSKLTKEDIRDFKHNKLTPKKRFITFTGDETDKQRNEFKKIFNDKINNYGQYIKYIIFSPSGATGITLKCVRFLGLGSVDFNFGQITQILGRCNRLNSHIDLPIKDRTLTNKIYLSTKNKKYYQSHKKEIDKLCSRKTWKYEKEDALCIERIIYQDSKKDDLINLSFRQVLKEVSII